MKKTFAMLLALCLCCSCLFDAGAACADGGEGGAGADPEDELGRALEAGLLPEDWLEDMEQTISFEEYTALCSGWVEGWDESRLKEWGEHTELASASSEPMAVEDGFLLLSYLWIMMGCQSPQLPAGYEPWAGGDQELRDAAGSALSWDYPLFPDYEELVYEEYGGNYIWGALQVLPDVCSAVSGERVFEYDEKEQSLHLDRPLSRDRAVRALLRLTEYREGLVFDAVVDRELLPDYDGADFALGAPFQEGRAELGLSFQWESQVSDTRYTLGPELEMSFRLLLPDSLVRALEGQGAELLCAVDVFGEDMAEISRSCEDALFRLSYEEGRLLAEGADGEKFTGSPEGKRWQLDLRTDMSYETEGSIRVNMLCPRLHMSLQGYEDSFYTDDLVLSSLGKDIVSCDFDFTTAYGRSGEEQFTLDLTDERLWGWTLVESIGEQREADCLRIGVNFTGESYEPESEEFLGSVDTGGLHNPEHDWRNWGGLTCWWHMEGRTGAQAELKYGMVIPKDIEFGPEAEEPGLDLGAGFGFGSYYAYDGAGNQELKEYEAPAIKVWPGGNGNTVISAWGDADISVTAYNDCYYVEYTGRAELPEEDYELAVVKLSWTGDAVTYSGYFYLTGLSLSCGDEEILRLSPGEETPAELFHCYNHGTNGSYYYWSEQGSSNYHLGFDSLKMEK